MKKPDKNEVREAYNRIKSYINRTPVLTSGTLNSMVDAEVFIKCENFQKVGAFKSRGAFNALLQLSNQEKNLGVVAHSSGNHAQAVAFAAKILQIHATIVMPRSAPLMKKKATLGYGAEVIECDDDPATRAGLAKELEKEFGYTPIHPFNDLKIIHGAGTAALELIEDTDNLDAILMPVGGGGLTSGTALIAKSTSPSIKIIAVEPEIANDAYLSFYDGKKLYPPFNTHTIADGLRTGLGDITFEIIKNKVDHIILVSELEIIEAMQWLWERMKIIVEPSGAVPIAGLLKLKKENSPLVLKKRIGAIISGGNIDFGDFFATLKEKSIDKTVG